MTSPNSASDNLSEAIAYLREVHRGTVRAERVEVLVHEIERLRSLLKRAQLFVSDLPPLSDDISAAVGPSDG